MVAMWTEYKWFKTDEALAFHVRKITPQEALIEYNPLNFAEIHGSSFGATTSVQSWYNCIHRAEFRNGDKRSAHILFWFAFNSGTDNSVNIVTEICNKL